MERQPPREILPQEIQTATTMRILHPTLAVQIKKCVIFVALGMTFVQVIVPAVPEDRGPHAPITLFMEPDANATIARYMKEYVIVV